MKICFFGAGAIGGYLAGHIARADGCEVSVIARGAHLEAIRRNGLRVLRGAEELSVRVMATDCPAELAQQDYIFLTVKAHQLDAVLDQLSPLLGPGTALLPPTSGVPYWFFHDGAASLPPATLERLDPGGRQRAAIVRERVIGCVYWIPTEIIAPGVVRQNGSVAAFPIGELDGAPSDRTARLSEAMRAGGVIAPVSADIRAEIWMKMASSLVWNSAALLTEATLGQIAKSSDAVDVVRRMVVETNAVADRIGLRLPRSTAERMAIALDAEPHRMSMLQDLQLGRPLEFDAVKDSFLAVRDHVGVPTPVLNSILPLASLRARLVEATAIRT
jgi:2-dehydropantoate 2-reductase